MESQPSSSFCSSACALKSFTKHTLLCSQLRFQLVNRNEEESARASRWALAESRESLGVPGLRTRPPGPKAVGLEGWGRGHAGDTCQARVGEWALLCDLLVFKSSPDTESLGSGRGTTPALIHTSPSGCGHCTGKPHSLTSPPSEGQEQGEGGELLTYFFISSVSRKTLPGAKEMENPGQVWGDRELGPGCLAGWGKDTGAPIFP